MPGLPSAIDQRQLPRYVGQREIARMLGCSVRTLQRIRSDDAMFPKPVVNGKQRKAWRVEEVLAWDDARRVVQHAALLANAVASPDAISEDNLPATLGALGERLLRSQGAELLAGDVLGVSVIRQLTAEQAAARRAAELDAQFEVWGELFANLSAERAMVVANWLFPALRKQWSDTAHQTGRAWALPTDAEEAERMAWGTLATADERD